MALQTLHGLIQLARITAEQQPKTIRIDSAGTIWKQSPVGWIKAGVLHAMLDREDFLVAQLGQEEI